MTAPNGCTGACCAAFYMPYSLSEIKRGTNPRNERSRFADGEQIADMVIPIGPTQAAERLSRVTGEPVDPDGLGLVDGRVARFTCRHWDPDTKLCGIYADRPAMCRHYPPPEGCRHDDACTCVPTP